MEGQQPPAVADPGECSCAAACAEQQRPLPQPGRARRGCCASLHGQYVASADVTRYYGCWRPPDESKAATRHRAEHAHHDFFDAWSARVVDLKEFGVGHMLYFSFLWWMAALFCGLSLLVAAPNVALNLAGRYYGAGQLELTTLGNFGRVAVAHNSDGSTTTLAGATGWERELEISSAFLADASLPPSTSPFNKAAAITAASALDCIGAGLYFVTTLGLIWLARRRAEDADTHTVTIHDYSVHVSALPGDASAPELAAFFGQWGEVVHVEVVRAYGRLVRLVLERGQQLQQLQGAIAALQKAAQDHPAVPAAMEAACHKIRERVQQLDSDIEAEQAEADTARVVGAFVTFKDEASKLACLRDTPRSRVRQWLRLRPEHKLRRRHALTVCEAPEPSDVQFENMEHGGLQRFGRAALVTVASYGALGLGFVLISLASAARLNLSRAAGVSGTDCAAGCRMAAPDGSLGLSDADRALYSSCAATGRDPSGAACSAADSGCYRCFCFAAITAGAFSEGSYCSGAGYLLALEWSSSVGIVLAILGINMLLTLTSRRLTLFEKHHTRSLEARSLAHKLFLGQFLNSALSTVIANAHLPFLADAVAGGRFERVLFQGVLTDLTPEWYKLVGRSLLVSQLLAAALRVLYLGLTWASARYRYLRRARCLTQDQLEGALRGPAFDLDYRYGEHLNVIYVSLLLSGGMPAAYIIAALWFVSAYWCDKVELLALSRRPVTYGPHLSHHVMNLLPYAAVWHAVFALWAFSLFGVPRSGLVTDAYAGLVARACSAMSGVWASTSGMSAQQAAQRLTAADSAHLLILLIVLVGVLFIKLTTTTWLRAGRWLLNLVGVVADEEDTQSTGAPEFGVAVRTQLLVGEASYAIHDQPAYAAAFTKMQQVEGDVLVQVVLKGAAQASKQHQHQHQHQHQRQPSPRAPSLLDAAPGSPPGSAGGGLAAGPAQPQMAGSAEAALAAAGTGPGWEGGEGSAAASQQLHLAAADVPRVSRGSLFDGGGGSVAPALSSRRTSGELADARVGSPAQQQQQLSAAQRFRAARANKVVPIAEEFLQPARGG